MGEDQCVRRVLLEQIADRLQSFIAHEKAEGLSRGRDPLSEKST